MKNNICDDCKISLEISTDGFLTCFNCGKTYLDEAIYVPEYDNNTHSQKQYIHKKKQTYDLYKRFEKIMAKNNIFLKQDEYYKAVILFKQIQNEYKKITTRKNFMNYEYILEKILYKIDNDKYNFKKEFKCKNTKIIHDLFWAKMNI